MSSSDVRSGRRCARLLVSIAMIGLSLAAYAATYTAPSGYFQIIGYKLQRGERDGEAVLAVAGWVQALADCRGAALLFDVLDRSGRPVGAIRITHGAFFRHDRWTLDPGEFTPQGGDAAAALAAAHSVEVREAECTANR
jgi:hypothetical protein